MTTVKTVVFVGTAEPYRTRNGVRRKDGVCAQGRRLNIDDVILRVRTSGAGPTWAEWYYAGIERERARSPAAYMRNTRT